MSEFGNFGTLLLGVSVGALFMGLFTMYDNSELSKQLYAERAICKQCDTVTTECLAWQASVLMTLDRLEQVCTR